MASPSVSPNPWAVAAGHTENEKTNPWATAARGAGGASSLGATNPWAVAAQSGSGRGGRAPAPLVADHATTATPVVARSQKGNWVTDALTAGNRFGKHLAATGQLGLPDAAGEAADDARINDFLANLGGKRGNWGGMMGSALDASRGVSTPGGSSAGLAEGLVRTGLDPTLLIPAGAISKGVGLLGKGLGAGAEAGARTLGPLLQRAPGVANAAREGIDLARGGANAVGDLFRWGGSTARKIDPEKYADAVLSSNRAGASEQELARRLAVGEAAIFKNLTPAQKLDALRVAHGEVDVASDPAVNAAAKAYRKLRNDEFYLQASTSGRRRVALGSPTVANARFRDLVAPPKPPPDEFEQMVPAEDDLWASGMPRHPEAGPGRYMLRGGEAGINRAAAPLQRQYELPENLREFTQPEHQGILGAEQYRKNQIPGAHPPPTEAEAAALAKARPEPYNRLFPSAPQAKHQKPFRIGEGEVDPTGKLTTDSQKRLAALEEAIAGSHKATARQTAAAQLRSELGVGRDWFLDPASKPEEDTPSDALLRLFQQTPRAKGAARNLVERAQDVARVPADLARAGLTAFGLKHGSINVPVLADLSEGPKAVAGMVGDAARLMRMNPEEKWEYLRDAREAGVLGPEFERKNPIVEKLEGLPLAGRAAIGAGIGGYEGQDIENRANPQGSLLGRIGGGALGAGLGAGGGALRLGGHINDLTWALDEAAKARAYAAKAARGVKPAEAATQTLGEMIDYAHRTPIAQTLQDWGLAPFATFATKVPGAVARSIARDPRKAMLLDRLSQGLAGQGNVDLPQAPLNDKGEPTRFSMSTPLSETAELASDPSRYLRTKASAPARWAGDILAEVLTRGGRGSHYMTYGEPLLPHKTKLGEPRAGAFIEDLVRSLPLGTGDELLGATGTNEYPQESAISQILGPLVGGYVR